MDVKIESSWKEKLKDEFSKDYFISLTGFVREEYGKTQVFPPGGLIFKAFDLCPFDRVKVVIIGQDPYHGPGQAHGLCFSVREGIDFPPSLVNIFKEIESDLGIKPYSSGNLSRWAAQGVFLLNATLTVRARQAASHQGKGWEEFTDAAISVLNNDRDNLVFFCGAPMHRRREHQLTGTGILFLNPFILPPFPPQGDFSETGISAAAISILRIMVLLR